MIQDKNGDIRFEQGTEECCCCGAKENIVQFQMENKIKGLPVTEIRFVCQSCAIEKGIITEKELKDQLNKQTEDENDARG